MPRTACPLVLFFLATFAGCFPAQGELCGLSAVYSVQVEVSSSTEETLADAAVFFRVLDSDIHDDSQPSAAFEACEQLGSSFGCGVEADGRIEVMVEAQGHEEASHIVEVGQGQCHVEPEHLVVQLEPLSCTAEAAPSVVLSLVDEQGQAIPGAFAGWGLPFDDSAWQECEALGTDFACGWEQSGILEVTAGAPGYQPWMQSIEVEAGECHVQTRYIEVALEESDTPCTSEIRPSIVVVVTDTLANPLPSAETHFVPHLKPLEPAPCYSTNNGRFFCGEEEPGEFDVLVRAEGYLPWSTTVRVDRNECHVETQYLLAELTEMVFDG